MVLPSQYAWTLIVGTLVVLILIGAFIASLNISLRRLKQEQDFVSSILNTTHALILVLDSDGRVVHFNKSCEAITGLPVDDALGCKLTELPVIGEEPHFAGSDFQAHPPPPLFDSRFFTEDGSQHVVTWTSTTVNGTNGNFQTILTGIDITERELIEEALRESEERFRKLFESATVGLAVENSDGKLIQTNGALQKILGYSGRELRELTLMDIISPDDRDTSLKSIQELQSGKRGHIQMINRFRRKDGRVIWGSTSVVSYKDIRNTLKYSFAMIEDITPHKNAEEKLRKSRQELRKLSAHLQSVREEERTHIAREMHDELGQALSILQMDLSWLESRLPEREKSWLEKLKSMTEAVQKTILTVQKISRELRPSVLDNLGLVAAIEWQAQEIQKRSGIRCKVDVIDDEIATNPEISTALFRILQEGLTNVVRHSKATSVKIKLREKENKLTLEINDNGVGITEDEITSPDAMGLIGMKERAEFLQGEFKIRGIPGKGTRLTVTVAL